ncbi:MAG: hypothetical protein L3J28_09980 [Candidatus Polarisedimenticolaceae bacterium]|nr:hypothetical protein [Candidatus Polarisedimenticolaceae bacterium]
MFLIYALLSKNCGMRPKHGKRCWISAAAIWGRTNALNIYFQVFWFAGSAAAATPWSMLKDMAAQLRETKVKAFVQTKKPLNAASLKARFWTRLRATLCKMSW